MSIEKNVEILTSNGFKHISALHMSEQLLNVQHKTLKYSYPTQILNYTSMLFFHVYSNKWISKLLLNESVKLIPFPLQMNINYESDILEILTPYADEYIVELVGATFENVPCDYANKIQVLACKSGLFCIITVTDLLHQLYSVEFPDNEVVDTNFLPVEKTSNVDSIAISTSDYNSVYICRKFTDAFVYVPFLIKN